MVLNRVDRLTDSFLVRDVFPYNVVGAGLTNERFFSRMWKYIEQRPQDCKSGFRRAETAILHFNL